MFKAIGSFVGRIFGSPENTGKTIDMIRDGVDALVFTEEEKAAYSQKGSELYLEYLKVTSDGGHIARRLIGLIVTFVWALFVCTVGLLYTLSIWMAGFADAAAALLEVLIKVVLPSFGGVMLFYFGHRMIK